MIFLVSEISVFKEVFSMELEKVVEILEQIAPLELADDFDRGKIGVILGENDIKKITVALDANFYILKKAAEMRADLLITHHTLIFHPINKVSKSLASSLKLAFENGISLYTMHTNYDREREGINSALAVKIGLKNCETADIGRIGEVEPCSSAELASHISECLKTPVVYAGQKGKGSGGLWLLEVAVSRVNFLKIGRANRIDAFISLRTEA